MKTIFFVAIALAVVTVSKVNADEISKPAEKSNQQIVGVSDFSKEYLETIVDEKALQQEIARQDREDHDRYMRKIAHDR
jgi:hypothetical protein